VYVPGVCNIGPAEIGRRRRIGWLGLSASVIMCVGLLIVEAAPTWSLAVWLPASVGASGFIQAHRRFCANFGYRGLFNFDDLGAEQRVAVEEARREDRRTAYRIGIRSAVFGAAAALLAFAIALVW
jgi:hypothetical protein